MIIQKKNNIKEKWGALQEEGVRIRDAAQRLSVSELELLLTEDKSMVKLLKNEPKTILKDLEGCGKVMALTRNDDVVHERKGTYTNPMFKSEHVGLYANEDIDLRIFWEPWTYSVAVKKILRTNKIQRSIHFFSADGTAIHKVYLLSESNTQIFDDIVNKYGTEDLSIKVLEYTNKSEEEVQLSGISLNQFQDEWINLKDTHDFFGLIKKYNISRITALKSAPSGHYAVLVSNDILKHLLNEVSKRDLEIMVFVGNRGMIQIHTGKAKKIVEFNNWLNVMDPDFNLHVKTDNIKFIWVVRKPTKDGIVTAIECFNENEEMVLQFFGKRKPGIPEASEWSSLVNRLEKLYC